MMEGRSSVGRASDLYPEGRGFESRRGLSSELSFALPKIVVPAGSGQTISSESKSGVSR